MAFIKEKTIGNQTYYYMIANHRIDGKVKQDSVYLGIKRPFKAGSAEEKGYLDCFQECGASIMKLTFPMKGKKWKEMVESMGKEEAKASGGTGYWLIESHFRRVPC